MRSAFLGDRNRCAVSIRLVSSAAEIKATSSVPRRWMITTSPLAVTSSQRGIPDLFPQLNVVCSEFELSWIPHFMWRIDELQGPYGFGPRTHLLALRMKASDYVKTRIY